MFWDHVFAAKYQPCGVMPSLDRIFHFGPHKFWFKNYSPDSLLKFDSRLNSTICQFYKQDLVAAALD